MFVAFLLTVSLISERIQEWNLNLSMFETKFDIWHREKSRCRYTTMNQQIYLSKICYPHILLFNIILF